MVKSDSGKINCYILGTYIEKMHNICEKVIDRKNLLVYNTFLKSNLKTRRFCMKYSKSDIQSKVHSLPNLKFEDQSLTSFAGLVIIQKFFAAISLKQRLQSCFTHLNKGKILQSGDSFYASYHPLDPRIPRIAG